MVLGIGWKLGFILHQVDHKLEVQNDKIIEVLVLGNVFRNFGNGIGILVLGIVKASLEILGVYVKKWYCSGLVSVNYE